MLEGGSHGTTNRISLSLSINMNRYLYLYPNLYLNLSLQLYIYLPSPLDLSPYLYVYIYMHILYIYIYKSRTINLYPYLSPLGTPRFDNEDLGDTSTLADPSVVEVLKSYHPRKTNGYKS